MNILMLISELGYGGAATAFVNLASELAKTNRVEIIVFKEQAQRGNYHHRDLPEGLTIHRLDPPTPFGRVKRWTHRVRKLRALKREIGADATISFLTGPNALNAVAGGKGITIISIRGSRLYDFNSSPTARWFTRTLIDPIVHRRADAIVSVSTGLTREISGGRDDPSSKFHTIAGYVDSAAILASATAAIEREIERLAGEPLLVTAGRLSREKGLDHLLRLFARVRCEVDGAKLLVIGDGPQFAELIAICSALGLSTATGTDNCGQADVIFLGYRAEPNRYFRLAKAFVLPSLSEGFPNILVEALGAAVPVIVADTPWGSSDVVGVERDAANCPYPRSTPLVTDFGLLMPRIDDLAHDDDWVISLTEILTQPPDPTDRTGEFHDRVRLYSCANAAERWNMLIHRLAQRRARNPIATSKDK